MLNGLIEEIKSIDLSKYTTSSVSKLNKELSKAMNVLNSEEATQKDVDKAFNNLKKAKDDLVAKADNVNPTNPTNPSYPTKPGNGGKTPSGGKLPNTGGAMGSLGLLGIGGALAVAGLTIIKKRKN
ncbi:FIVAR domain-containing protein [Clostridium chauvoei]|nr:LPXTG cell wall anchor domain-containing protein [Clostridium chauvoei]MBX7310436.1 FIVAR domain-containing protein [Clostridium chauvoei]